MSAGTDVAGTDASMTSGTGLYFDGQTSARQVAQVVLGGASLQIAAHDGRLLAEWPYDDILELNAPDQVLRIGRRGSPFLERLEIRDPAFAAAVDDRAIYVDRTGALRRKQRLHAIGLTFAATATLLLVAYFGVPALADRAAPLVPVSVEQKLGEAVDGQTRAMLDRQNLGDDFECRNEPGRAALDKVMRRLEATANLRVPLRLSVVRRKESNAIALPGGRVYVFEGLIDEARNPDELAGVIAHEMGHVANRDGTKAVLQAGGLSVMFGMLLGDFIGGGAVVIAARTVLQSSYTRQVEAAADTYAARLMNAAGGDARALGTILERIGGATEPGAKILLDHPETVQRVAAIGRLADPRAATPLLDDDEWTDLRNICTR